MNNKDVYEKHPRVRGAKRNEELEILNKSRDELAKDELKDAIEFLKTGKASEIIEKEEEELKKLQRNPGLFVETIKEVQKEVSGEEDTIAAIIIIATTRLVENAIPESTNLLLSDKTGLGKDHTTKKTLDVIIPEDQHLHVTKMTPESFTYWHYKEEGWSWDKKVIHFEDITQYLLNCSTFKVMSSGDNYAVVVKDQKTIEIPIFGKPCMILTSHHANPRDEALRRFRIGALNDTKQQTRKIIGKISQRYTGVKEIEKNELLRSVVQNLKSYPVVIPYAEIIQHFFPDSTLMRTQYHCFLDYIAGSAIFHQYQREKTENGEIIATPDDYMIARMVLIYTTSNPLMIPMSKEYRDICTILENNGSPMTVSEIELQCDQSKSWLYEHLPRIASTKVIKKGRREEEKANKPVTTYEYAPHLNVKKIPTWHEISNQIRHIVDKTKKTNKTKKTLTGENTLENWFSTHDVKPIKPPEKNEKGDIDYLVFHGRRIPLNGKVLLVFLVFAAFLRKRDKQRYKRYFEGSIDEPFKDDIENLVQWLNEKHNGEYTGDWMNNADFPFSIDTVKEGVKLGIIETLDQPLRVSFIPDFIPEDLRFKEDQELTKRIYQVMNKKKAYEWHYTEIARELDHNTDDLDKAIEVNDYLKNLTMNPKNNSGIGRSKNEGYYHLTRIGGNIL